MRMAQRNTVNRQTISFFSTCQKEREARRGKPNTYIHTHTHTHITYRISCINSYPFFVPVNRRKKTVLNTPNLVYNYHKTIYNLAFHLLVAPYDTLISRVSLFFLYVLVLVHFVVPAMAVLTSPSSFLLCRVLFCTLSPPLAQPPSFFLHAATVFFLFIKPHSS